MPKPVTGGKEEEEEDDDDGCLDGRCSFPWRELTTTATGNCSSELYFASFSLFSAHSTCPIAIYHRIIVRFTYSFKVQHRERKHESSKHSEKRKTEKRRQQSSSVFHFDSTRVSLRQCLGECVLVTLKFALAAKREGEDRHWQYNWPTMGAKKTAVRHLRLLHCHHTGFYWCSLTEHELLSRQENHHNSITQLGSGHCVVMLLLMLLLFSVHPAPVLGSRVERARRHWFGGKNGELLTTNLSFLAASSKLLIPPVLCPCEMQRKVAIQGSVGCCCCCCTAKEWSRSILCVFTCFASSFLLLLFFSSY